VTLKKVLIGISAAALMGGAAIAADAGVKAGAAVSDTTGAPVGTIEAVNGDLAVVSTGTSKVSLPVSAFGQGAKGPVIAMTKTQLDSAASGAKASAQAELKAQLTKGTSVYGSDGGVVGTVDTVDAQFATLALGDQKVKLPLDSFAKGAQGATIGMTAAELKAAASASASQSAAAATTTPAQN
jgi:preprotein translocase subunit YajC